MLDEFMEELKNLCEKYDARIETCSCCGLDVWVGNEVLARRETTIDKQGMRWHDL